ncbi:DUF3068 domain-containing protein [Corynebacterium uterequi]|uniref:Putative DUF3068 family protein n=1 Tax=Corynebacterium uterequi TaxID=1072256 RepID=A0A0G3HGQ7_9CORY|nr:DUF3068 domain-containing protein [Corynebacterium uterequi]AKK10317.1 putative DUF3068 family protein [Corynebacterium uterequi]
MLPKSRILSAVLVGLGIALLVGGLVAPMLLKADGRLPLDLSATTWSITDQEAVTSAKFDPAGTEHTGPVTQQLHMEIQAPSTQDTATVRIGSTWVRDDAPSAKQGLLEAQTWSYVLDRVTGAPVSEATLTHTVGFPPVTVPMEGHWLKFPSNAQQTTYDLFDETLQRAYPAVFVDSEVRGDRTVYHYRQEIAPTSVHAVAPGMFTSREVPVADAEDSEEDAENAEGTEEETTEEAEPKTETLELYHAATRDVYVDQLTGIVVDADVSVRQFYGRSPREAVQTALDFSGSLDDARAAELMGAVSQVASTSEARYTRWATVGVGAIILAFGLLGAFGLGGSRRRTLDKVSPHTPTQYLPEGTVRTPEA